MIMVMTKHPCLRVGCHSMKNRGDDLRGVNGSRIKFLSQETGLRPMFKTPRKTPSRKVMKNTNQQDINNPHKVMKVLKNNGIKQTLG
jgi:hypothetical protein